MVVREASSVWQGALGFCLCCLFSVVLRARLAHRCGLAHMRGAGGRRLLTARNELRGAVAGRVLHAARPSAGPLGPRVS